MLFISVPDMNDSISRISIDNKTYGLRFTYNEKYDYWNFGIYDDNDNPIVSMTRIVPNFPIMFFYTYTELPDGVFGCISDIDTVGRNAFKDKTAEFVYIPNDELAEVW